MKNVKKIGLLLGIIIANCYADQLDVNIVNSTRTILKCDNTDSFEEINIENKQNHTFSINSASALANNNFSCSMTNEILSQSWAVVSKIKSSGLDKWNETILKCEDKNVYLYLRGAIDNSTYFDLSYYECSYSHSGNFRVRLNLSLEEKED